MYVVTAPSTPGATHTEQGRENTLSAARKISRNFWRRDLTAQDVRIEQENGRLVEYAGPTR